MHYSIYNGEREQRCRSKSLKFFWPMKSGRIM
nr:MAG TPA: hypothetical protein [Caudoviricetes sp.]